jgi:hypothetical protein
VKEEPAPVKPAQTSYKDRLWKGWILPAAEADNWLTAGSAAYYEDLQSDDLDRALEVRRADFRNASIEEPDAMQSFRMTTDRGVLLLEDLRRHLGDDKFFDLMTSFFAVNTTKAVSTAQFIDAAGEKERGFIESWLQSRDLPGDLGGATYLLSEYHPLARAIGQTIIIYGTAMDAGANRYAAERLQSSLLGWYESEPPVLKDFEVGDDDLRAHDVIFVGRPETNSALAHLASRLKLDYTGAEFRIAGVQHASERDALALAATNPLNPHRAVTVLAGNSALETVRLAQTLDFPAVEYAVYSFGKETASGFLK